MNYERARDDDARARVVTHAPKTPRMRRRCAMILATLGRSVARSLGREAAERSTRRCVPLNTKPIDLT